MQGLGAKLKQNVLFWEKHSLLPLLIASALLSVNILKNPLEWIPSIMCMKYGTEALDQI